jgi:integrase
MSNEDSKDLTGFDKLLSNFAEYQDMTPKGVGMVRRGNQIHLQFKYPGTGKRNPLACGCAFTYVGMEQALEVSKRVAEKLKTVSSASEFKDWYESEVLKVNEVKNDLLTFEQAFNLHRNRFFSRTDKIGRKRTQDSASNLVSYDVVYGRFFNRIVNKDNIINVKDILALISNQSTERVKWDCKNAFLNLLDVIEHKSMYEQVKSKTKNITRPKPNNDNQQTITLNEWLELRKLVLEDDRKVCQQYRNERLSWCWVFSIQILYGLRISEVWAIANLDKPFKLPKGSKVIPALNDPNNTSNEIYILDKTCYGHTVKTGNRLAVPLIPPTHPNLIDELGIKYPMLPELKFISNKVSGQTGKYNHAARRNLESWSKTYLKKKISQTHANRHLGNANGIVVANVGVVPPCLPLTHWGNHGGIAPTKILQII